MNPAATALKKPAERRSRPSKRFIGPPRPTLLQRVEQQIAADGGGRFSLGRWLAGLTDDELQQIEHAAHRHRGNILSCIYADPILKVSSIASRIQDAEGVARTDADHSPTRAWSVQNVVLETLVRAERMVRQGLLVIQGEPSMREDTQPAFVLTPAGETQGAALPDLAAAHAWRAPYEIVWDTLIERASKPRTTCPTCGQSVPA